MYFCAPTPQNQQLRIHSADCGSVNTEKHATNTLITVLIGKLVINQWIFRGTSGKPMFHRSSGGFLSHGTKPQWLDALFHGQSYENGS